ncbi:hypothetical protein DTL21_12390 [Bremerella cremea]|uniref:Outer membrane protein beta-barrel domain-containing protein n=1 Tax=Blastopirellula marina TaxID=124 RepID=A0A2S8FQ47_9BACT|nr:MULTISPECIES: hypothetical protein [Pirellulaceae]PQO34323.1 hypothetical protein C5Y83_12385 [Blastopirellula marina]RCS46819.1 hypothetical protein DTL21_12390 [Bremerella cremea]
MLSNRKALWTLVIVANLAAASSVQAQYDTVYPAAMQPFTDVNLENYDFQWFAPPITEQYGQDTIDPNTGIFFEYHRLFMNVSRGHNVEGGFNGDATYGNRVDFGFMTEEDSGWLFSGWRLDGPAYDLVNRGDLNSFEGNRTWRLPQFYEGFWMEPMVGLRFTQFNDKTNPFIFMQNNMLLGQVGTRVFSHRGQWTLKSELRAFAGNNWVYRGDIGDYSNAVIGGEFALGAAYHLTREISIDVSWNTLYFGKGVGRDPIAIFDSQEMAVTGVAFGVTLNR